MMKRFFTRSGVGFCSALLLASSLFTLFTPLLANAASTVDDAYVHTSHIQLSRVAYYGSTCAATDISTNWSVGITDLSNRFYNYGSGGNGSDAQLAMKNSFLNALSSPTGSWIVSTTKQYTGYSYDPSTNYDETVSVYWSDKPIEASFNDQGITRGEYYTNLYANFATDSTNNGSAQLSYYNGNLGGSQNCDSMVNYHGQTSGNGSIGAISNNGVKAYQMPTENYFITNGNITYPDGYSGDLPPSDAPPAADTTLPIDYSLSGTTITAQYTGNISTLDDTHGHKIPFKIQWLTNKADGTVIDEKELPSNATYQYKVPAFGHYAVEAVWLYNGVPYLPLPVNFKYIDTHLHVYVDGAISYSQSTDVLTPTRVIGTSGGHDYDSYSEISPYADCSTYGVDIVGGLGCVIGNFGTFLHQLLFAIFVPSPDFLPNWFNQLSSFFNSKFGFLATSVASLFGILTGIISAATISNPVISPPGTYFGAPVSFDISAMSGIVGPAGWAAILLLIRSTTAVAIVVGLYKTYQGIISEGKE